MFNCTPVFQWIYNCICKIIILQGGTASSKTYSAIQFLFTKAILEPRSVITIAGQDIPNLKKGAYRDAQTIYAKSKDLRDTIKFWNQSERTILFNNGSIIEFNSYSDEQDAKSGKRDYLFINEANGLSWIVVFQLMIRTRKQIIIDYNPTFAFWAHEKLIGTTPESNDLSATVMLFISDHRHNTFLSKDEHNKIEGIKDKQLWNVYARGRTGNITGLIFPEWQQIPDEQFPKDTPFFGGLDFGYTNDPTAGVKICKVGESIFIHELCYSPGIAPIQMKQIFEANGFDANTQIHCEHDPDNIAQLRRLGLRVSPARKGQGSINAGIMKLKEYKVFYTASSKNLEIEKQKYMWDIDKETGKSTNVPVDAYNHLIDSIRYGVYTQYFSSSSPPAIGGNPIQPRTSLIVKL